MSTTPMSMRSILAVAMATALAGCAGSFNGGDTTPPFRDPGMSMQTAGSVVVAGQSTKADVTAALGQATVITFDSGYEVWVYREKSSRPAAAKAEFVILFDRGGIAKKTRLRPADTTPGRQD
ncbi:MAG: hypothetical protein V4454_02965 [Pseudomonadota bacterium]